MTAPEPLLLAWSGGKDAALALERLRADPSVAVRALVTAVTRDFGRVSMHGVRRALLEAQARAVGLPLVVAELEAGASNAGYEAAWADALARADATVGPTRRIAYGDLFLEDVRAYRDRQLAALGREGVYPLWGEDTATLARGFVRRGHRAVLVCVDTTQLGGDFAGRDLDDALLAELPAGVDPCGERGEFHTFVWDGPLFSEPVPVRAGERVTRDGRFRFCDLLPEQGDAPEEDSR